MVELSPEHVTRFQQLLEDRAPLARAFSEALGGACLDNGLWRFFSDSWPDGGILGWNSESSWKQHWKPFLPSGVLSFGEDIFGNQLLLCEGFPNAMLWNHESAELFDRLVEPGELLKTVVDCGIDWIDFYADGMLSLARQCQPVSWETHLHWITPLILGGPIDESNLAVMERNAHLVGHAQLWSQISDLPPGTVIVPG